MILSFATKEGLLDIEIQWVTDCMGNPRTKILTHCHEQNNHSMYDLPSHLVVEDFLSLINKDIDRITPLLKRESDQVNINLQATPCVFCADGVVSIFRLPEEDCIKIRCNSCSSYLTFSSNLLMQQVLDFWNKQIVREDNDD